MQKSKSGLSSSLSSSLSLSSSPSLSSSIADSLTPSNIDSAQTVSKVRMANSHGSAAQEGYEATIDPSVPQHYVHARAPVVHGTLQNALPGAAAAANAGLGETGGNIFIPGLPLHLPLLRIRLDQKRQRDLGVNLHLMARIFKS